MFADRERIPHGVLPGERQRVLFVFRLYQRATSVPSLRLWVHAVPYPALPSSVPSFCIRSRHSLIVRPVPAIPAI